MKCLGCSHLPHAGSCTVPIGAITAEEIAAALCPCVIRTVPADAQIAQILQQTEELHGMFGKMLGELGDLAEMRKTQELILGQQRAISDEFLQHHDAMLQVPRLVRRMEAVEERCLGLEHDVDFRKHPPISREDGNGNGEAA